MYNPDIYPQEYPGGSPGLTASPIEEIKNKLLLDAELAAIANSANHRRSMRGVIHAENRNLQVIYRPVSTGGSNNLSELPSPGLGTKALTFNGANYPGSWGTQVEKFTYASESIASVGEIPAQFGWGIASNMGTPTTGFVAGGSGSATKDAADITNYTGVGKVDLNLDTLSSAGTTLPNPVVAPASMSAETFGLLAGGYASPTWFDVTQFSDRIVRIDYANSTTSLLSETLGFKGQFRIGLNSATHGYAIGGNQGLNYRQVPVYGNVDRITYGDLTQVPLGDFIAPLTGPTTGLSSRDSGYLFGGYSNNLNNALAVFKLSFNGETYQNLGQRLVSINVGGSCFQGSDRGYVAHPWKSIVGYVGAYARDIQRFDFATDSLAPVGATFAQCHLMGGTACDWNAGMNI